LDIVEISNNSLFPDEIQKGNDENNPPSIFFSDLIPSKTSIDINKKKLSRSSDKDDISDSDSDFLTSSFHPASSDMAVEAFYHGNFIITIIIFYYNLLYTFSLTFIISIYYF